MPAFSAKWVRNISPRCISSSVSVTSASICIGPFAVTSVKVSRRMASAGWMRASNKAASKSNGAANAAALRNLAKREWQPSVLGRQSRRRSVGAQLGCHAAFRAAAEADLDDLIRPELREPEAPQRLHVHENVGSAF